MQSCVLKCKVGDLQKYETKFSPTDIGKYEKYANCNKTLKLFDFGLLEDNYVWVITKEFKTSGMFLY